MPRQSFKLDIPSKYIFYIVIFICILLSSLFIIDKDKEVYEAFNEAISFEKNCETNIGSCIQGEEEKILAMEKKFVNIESQEYLDEDESDDEERRCFDVVLPVTFLMPDGSSLVVAEESDWRSIDEWYVESSDVEEEPDYQFPIEVVYDSEEGSNTVVINNQEELQAAEQDCLEDEE